MRPDELLRKLKKAYGSGLQVVSSRGKGSHSMIYLNGRKAPLKQDGDMGPGTVKAFLKQLGIADDFPD